jgi:hypothetical protein
MPHAPHPALGAVGTALGAGATRVAEVDADGEADGDAEADAEAEGDGDAEADVGADACESVRAGAVEASEPTVDVRHQISLQAEAPRVLQRCS